MDMLDMLDQTGYRLFKTEMYHCNLNNLPQRRQSGSYSEVNFLVLREVTTRSLSMKRRRSTVRRGRRQKLKHVDDTESISLGLSDTDSSQSDDVVEITDHVSVIRDMMQPVRKSRAGRLRKDETSLSVVESCGFQKISLAPDAMAEDTLEKLRLTCEDTQIGSTPTSPVESRGEFESVLDQSSTEMTVMSGPSSPCHPVDTVLCRKCKRLFTKMRKHPTPKMKSKDANPASLSCDVWVLLKKWHPQRHRHREKGLLWKSLIKIRKLSQGSNSAAVSRTQTNCSRPHVFQERNLRRCEYLSSHQTNVSITKARTRNRKRQRIDWPPIVGWRSKVKRKPSMNNTLSEQHFPLDLCVRATQENELLIEDKTLMLNADLEQNSDASSKQRRANVRAKSNEQEESDGIDVTRRVLKFDDTPETVAVETAEERKSPRQQQEHREIREAQNVFHHEQREESSEVSDGFRTPTDVFSVKPMIKRENQKKVSASGDSKPAVKKANFKSLLATMVRKQNQIIKEPSK